MDTTKEMLGPPTTELIPESGTEITEPPTMDDAKLPSPHSLERVDTAEHPQAAEGARVVGGVGFPWTAAQSQELSLRQIIVDRELGLFFWKGMSRWPSGTKTTLLGLKNSMPCP